MSIKETLLLVKILLSNNILIIEKHCNLEKITKTVYIIAIPLKLIGSTGSPVCAIAIEE